MRQFFNGLTEIVSQSIDGLVAASGGELVRFAAGGHARVVMRSDWDKSKVAVVSGGGSGHEPAHAGLVGRGLLTAAVCGEVFASPSVDAVLAAIVAVTGPAGCLLVVKNYTGDRLNFGLAAEKAKALGLRVEMVVVADDIAIPDAAQPRGLAGTVFIHKIAGHMSESGASLMDIARVASAARERVFTIGVARDTCRVPGLDKVARIAPEEAEVGLGIHGEPGVDVARFESSRALMADLAARLAARLTGARYAVLINDLGGLSGLEMLVLTADLMQTPLAAKFSHIAGPVAIMTSLDMPGFSISCIELTPEIEPMLLAPVSVAAFPAFKLVVGIRSIAPPMLEVRSYVPSVDPQVRRVVEAIIQTCIGMEADINALDARVGDGDTGSTFASAARRVQSELDGLPFADGQALLSALSDIKRKAMGGSSGVLMAIVLASASEAFRAEPDWAVALLHGLGAMQAYGGAAVGDRTMIDALKPALDVLVANGGLGDAAEAARTGADATGQMLRARSGRSAYLEARSLAGVNDPGAEAVARIFEALARLLR
jgi:dihydroxyacetone kinase